MAKAAKTVKQKLSDRGLTKIEERARKDWLKLLSTYLAMVHPDALNGMYISITNGGDAMDIWKEQKDTFLKGVKKADVKELNKWAQVQFVIDEGSQADRDLASGTLRDCNDNDNEGGEP
jgi:hypothetical protein